jgi:copper chaperone CopZ
MPETTFDIPGLLSQDDADAVMFELQDLPCVNQADVDLKGRLAWVSHTAMIAAEDIAAALLEAGYEAHPRSG